VFSNDDEAVRQVECQLPGAVAHASINDQGSILGVLAPPSTLHICSVNGQPYCTASFEGKARTHCGFDSYGRVWVFSDWVGGGDALVFELLPADRGPWQLREVGNFNCFWPAAFDAQGRFAAVDDHNRLVIFRDLGQTIFTSGVFSERITALDFDEGMCVVGDDAGNLWCYLVS
jgi:hypothetical protein